MDTKNNRNAVSSMTKITSLKRRKRRKWKSELYNSFDFFGDDNNCCFGMFPIWYWSNYFKALEWQKKHKVALWKSYALSLKHENQHLVMELQKQFPDRVFNTPLTFHNVYSGDTISSEKCKENEVEDDGVETEISNSGNEEIEFELSDEMLKFFEQSIRHKLEMRKMKEEKEKCDDIDKEVNEFSNADNQREKEMVLLYGDGSSMIIGMETAIKLSFDKYSYLKSPKYWPNIPLNV